MKQGKNIHELAQKLQHIAETKRDFVAPTSHLYMDDNARIHLGGLENASPDHQGFDLTRWAAHQVAAWGGIPSQYFDKLMEQNREVLSRNVNHAITFSNRARIGVAGIAPSQGERRLIRTIDGTARAFLSSRYRILDSSDLVSTVLPVAIDNGLEIASCDLTETRLYLKLTSPRLQAEVKKGDVVQYGIVVSTSDVGSGAARVEPFILRLVCLNGMIAPDSSIRKFHIGRDMEAESVREILSDATKQADDNIFWAKVRDVFLHSLKTEVFESLVDRLRVAAGEPIKSPDLNRVVELTSRAVGVTGDAMKGSILNHLARGGDLSRWGLVNAFTAAANDSDNYEVATSLERAGGVILDLAPAEWTRIAA